MTEYSFVIPVYNEEESLPVLFQEIKKAMSPLGKSFEVIFVNDCSTDRSPIILAEFMRQEPRVVRVITLTQRSGQTYAMKQGVNAVQGKIAFTLDADLQNDPADVPRLLEKMKEGYDVVCGWRKSRMDKPLKMALSKFGNVLQRIFSGLKIHDVSCTLRAYKQECLKDIGLDWEGQHRFIPLILSKRGYKIGEIVSNHRVRKFGQTKYNHRRIFRVVAHFIKILTAKY